MLERLPCFNLRDGALRIILYKIGILEAGDAGNHIEAFLMKPADCPFVEILPILGGTVVIGRRILEHGLGTESRTLIVLDIDYEGVDSGLLGKLYVLVYLGEICRREIDVERVAGLRHPVVLELRLWPWKEITVYSLSRSEAVLDGKVQGVVFFRHIAAQSLLLSRDKILGIDIAQGVGNLYFVAVHSAVGLEPVIAHYADLTPLFHLPCYCAADRVRQHGCRCAHIELLFQHESKAIRAEVREHCIALWTFPGLQGQIDILVAFEFGVDYHLNLTATQQRISDTDYACLLVYGVKRSIGSVRSNETWLNNVGLVLLAGS